jgi:hypothetical protein
VCGTTATCQCVGVKLVDHSAYVGEPQRVSVRAELREAAVRERADSVVVL